jgi:hypothetical protein
VNDFEVRLVRFLNMIGRVPLETRLIVQASKSVNPHGIFAEFKVSLY